MKNRNIFVGIVSATLLFNTILLSNPKKVQAAEESNEILSEKNIINPMQNGLPEIRPRGSLDTYLYIDKVLQNRIVSRKYVGTVTETSKVIINPTLTWKGITISAGSYEYSTTQKFKKYEVKKYVEGRYKKYNGVGMHIGYETIGQTLTYYEYVAI